MHVKHHPTKEAFELFRRGTLALGDIEAAGMRIDTKWMAKQTKRIDRIGAKLKDRLLGDKTWRIWQKRYGSAAKLGNRQQLATVLVKDLGCVITKHTNTDEVSTDKEALADINLPFVEDYVRMEGLYRTKSVYFKGVEREMWDGYLHPSFNLNVAVSYRSGSSDPNTQNWPQRNEELKKMVRGLIIPRKGHMIIETDFKTLEVTVAACYHKDKRMIKYLTDPKSDMHRDMAKEAYLIDHDWQIGELVRYCAKNMFVFPAFYGSFYPQLAKPMWNAIHRMGLCLVEKDGSPKDPHGRDLKRHLAKHGITEMGLCDPERDPVEGTFEYHIKKVEKHFWEDRFRQYAAWKKEYYAAYLRTGGFSSLTGFAYNGYFKRNAVVNYPIQGSAFHCLLWCIIQANAEMKKKKMKSMIIGQIHDSALGDVHVREKDDYIEMMTRITTVDLPRAWKWLRVAPTKIEIEAADPGLSWYHKKKVA